MPQAAPTQPVDPSHNDGLGDLARAVILSNAKVSLLEQRIATLESALLAALADHVQNARTSLESRLDTELQQLTALGAQVDQKAEGLASQLAASASDTVTALSKLSAQHQDKAIAATRDAETHLAKLTETLATQGIDATRHSLGEAAESILARIQKAESDTTYQLKASEQSADKWFRGLRGWLIAITIGVFSYWALVLVGMYQASK